MQPVVIWSISVLLTLTFEMKVMAILHFQEGIQVIFLCDGVQTCTGYCYSVSSANKKHDQSSKKRRKKEMMCKLPVHIILCPNSGMGWGDHLMTSFPKTVWPNTLVQWGTGSGID